MNNEEMLEAAKEIERLREIEKTAREFVSDSYRPHPKHDAERFDRLSLALGMPLQQGERYGHRRKTMEIEQLVTAEGIEAAAKAIQGRGDYEGAEELVLTVIRVLDEHHLRVDMEEPEPVVTEWWTNFYTHRVSVLRDSPEEAKQFARSDATEVAVHVVRADSIRVADLVTDEQINAARKLIRECGIYNHTAYCRRIFEALDKVREGEV